MKKSKSKKQSKDIQNRYFKNQYNSKIRQEYTDLDYIDKLDNTKKNVRLPDGTMVTEFEYMNIFMKEWNNADVSKQSEAKKNKLHRTAKEVKDCTDRNNARNRDVYGQARASNTLHKTEHHTLTKYMEKNRNVNEVNYVEDAMIDVLDKAKKSTDTED